MHALKGMTGLKWFFVAVFSFFGTGLAQSDDVLVIGMFTESANLDPHVGATRADATPAIQIFETLVYYDFQLQIQPLLATNWATDDFRVWDFTIRQGVHFHNGRPMTVDDVVYSLERSNDPDLNVSRRRLTMMESVEVLDENTVRITLTEAFPGLLDALSTPQTAIVPREQVEEYGPDFGRNPIGTGPFRLREWISDNRIVLDRFDDHWLGTPELSSVVFRTIPDPSTAMIELEIGGIDLVEAITEDALERLKNNPELVLGSVPGVTYRMLVMNSAQPEDVEEGGRTSPFGDPLVRRAVAHAVDWEALAVAVNSAPEFGVRSYCYVPRGHPSYSEACAELSFPYDPDRARELLAEAGVPDGFETEILIWQRTFEPLGVIIANYLAQVGIQANVRFIELATWAQFVNQGDFDLYLANWSAGGTLDPNGWFYSQFHSASFGSQGNRMRYHNEAVDGILLEAQSELDSTERSRLYQEAALLILPDVPQIPIDTVTQTQAWNEKVQGFQVHPIQGTFALWTPDAQVSVED